MLDMRSEGIEVRPLRELTGQTMFNEVFMSEELYSTTASSA